jgi:hypothetical protein
MPSPFPGMNPYLEQDVVWQDFHSSFMPLVRELLTAQVLPRYIVKIEELLFIHELNGGPRQFLGRAAVALAPGPAIGNRAPGSPGPRPVARRGC